MVVVIIVVIVVIVAVVIIVIVVPVLLVMLLALFTLPVLLVAASVGRIVVSVPGSVEDGSVVVIEGGVVVPVEPQGVRGVVEGERPLGGSALEGEGAVGSLHGRAGGVATNFVGI